MLLHVAFVLACFLPLGSAKPKAAIATPGPADAKPTPTGAVTVGDAVPPEGSTTPPPEGGGTPGPSSGTTGGDQAALVCVCAPSGSSFICKCNTTTTGESLSQAVVKPNPSTAIVPQPGDGGSGGSATKHPPSKHNGSATEPPIPVVSTFVFCVKKDAKTDKPVADYLVDSKGKSVKVQGQWLAYKCKYGLVEPFLINQTTYEEIKAQCVSKGFRFPQPSDDLHVASYPFQYEGLISEYYRHRTPFMFNRFPVTPADRCTDETRRRRQRYLKQ